MAKVRRGNPDAVARYLNSIVAKMSDPRAVAEAFGLALAQEIRDRGYGIGTPAQAHLVADAVYYETGDAQLAVATYDQAGRGTVGDLIFGAEFGSSNYTQFGPRNSSGYWLFPTVRVPPPNVIAAGEQGLDELIEDAL